MELEFSAVGDSVEHNGGKSQEEARQALHRGAEARRSAAPSERQDPGLRAVRTARPRADGFLPPAEGSLRERSGRPGAPARFIAR